VHGKYGEPSDEVTGAKLSQLTMHYFKEKKMDNRKLVTKKKKAVISKKQYHLITDIKNAHRDTSIVSFESKEAVQDYLVSEMERQIDYSFEDGDDIVICGELLEVTVKEKTYKVNIK
jgi:hypothetical protein